MRVFELARELNIPSKDLLTRLQGMGYKIDGNFTSLDEKTIAEVKTKMLEPVSRVEDAPAAEGEGEEDDSAESQPRRRRIISASRSGRAKKITESLGMTEPQEEDVKTREAVRQVPEDAPDEAAAAAEAPEAEGEEADAAPTRRLRRRGAEEETAAPEEVAAEAADTVEGETPAPAPEPPALGTLAAVPPPVEEGDTSLRPGGSKRMRNIPLPKPVAEEGAELREPARAGWRDTPRRGEKRRGADDVVPGRGSWRDMRRGRGGGSEAGGGDEEWVRPRRKGQRRKAPKAVDESKHTFNPRQKAIRIGDSIRVADLASAIGIKAADIIRKLMSLEIMATVNDVIDGETAELVAADYEVTVELVQSTTLAQHYEEEPIPAEQRVPRPPIVTIMGHVDHGKTTLLDYIRSTHVASGEAGGITQHIGAYFVESEVGAVTFLDTPGHEAFTSLRQRGANVTDIVILIVAADDGVMPQTVEAIEHAKAAEVPLIVAINKIDRPNAKPDRIKQQLMEYELIAEDFGGDTTVVPLSAATGEGVSNLLEIVHLQSEMLELRSTEEGPARGFVIESNMDRQRGPVGTIIVRRGTLRVGDHFVVGAAYGRVRAMYNDRGEIIEEALPSHPVEILGYNSLPAAGDLLMVVEDEKTARDIAAQKVDEKRAEDAISRRRVHLEDFFNNAPSDEEQGILNIVLKADTQGSLEALRGALLKEGNEKIRVEIIRAGVGGITETDVSLAATSDAIVLGFNVRPGPKAGELSRSEGVDVKTYTIIYELVDDIHAAMQGMLKPISREEVIGQVEVKDVFGTTKEGRIAGGIITEGKLERDAYIRVYRDNVVIHNGTLNSLRRFKDDVKEVQVGQECGFRIANFQDLQQGDLLEAYVRVEEVPTLERAGRSN